MSKPTHPRAYARTALAASTFDDHTEPKSRVFAKLFGNYAGCTVTGTFRGAGKGVGDVVWLPRNLTATNLAALELWAKCRANFKATGDRHWLWMAIDQAKRIRESRLAGSIPVNTAPIP